MERRVTSYRPSREREFDTGQLYQEFRMADLTRETGLRPLFNPDTRVYLSSKRSPDGNQYDMVFGKSIQKMDFHALFSNYSSSGLFITQGIEEQLNSLGLSTDLLTARDIALIKDCVGRAEDTSLSQSLSERLTTLDYSWNQIFGNRRYVKYIEREKDKEIPSSVFGEHAIGLANVMRSHPELWRKGVTNRSIGGATVARALSRLAQIDEQLRESVFAEELQNLPNDMREIAKLQRVIERFNGFPLTMGNGELGVLVNHGVDEEVIDMDGGLYKIKRNKQEAVVNLVGEQKHLADIYPQNDRFLVPAVRWTKSKNGVRANSFAPTAYFGPTTIEEKSADERIRTIRNFSGWQISPLAGILNIGYAGGYKIMNDSKNLVEIINNLTKESNFVLNNPIIERAESLAAIA